MKFTKFIVKVEEDKDIILFNTLNSATIKVNIDLYEKIKSNNISNLTYEETEFLKEACFLVSDDFDESGIQSIIKNVINNRINIVFITTDDCNFRCSYCYESHIKKSIDKNTYDDTLKFLNRCEKDELLINWFGGEPTLRMNEIHYFMQEVYKLKKFKRITSSIVTNGYLLSEKNFNQLINDHINNFQITLDGLKDEHNKHRFLEGGIGTFDTIIKNLKMMRSSSFDFSVCIRYNFNNDSKLIEFVDFIYDLIENDNRFVIDFQNTGCWSSDGNELPTRSDENKSIIKAIQKAYSLGMRLRLFEESITPYGSFCVANLNNSFVINSDRNILKCTVKLDWDKNIVGHLNEDGVIIFNNNLDLWRNRILADKCINCNVLPLCLNKYCPHMDYSICQKIKEREVQNVLRTKYCSVEK